MSATDTAGPLVTAMVGPGQPVEGSGTQVELELSGLKPRGRVLAQVYADAAAMKAREPAVLRFSVDPAGAPRVRAVVPLPPGRYAIAAFQDTQGTGKMETRLGMPIVPYGFSNDARGKFGPPSFDAAAFDVAGAATKVSLPLR